MSDPLESDFDEITRDVLEEIHSDVLNIITIFYDRKTAKAFEATVDLRDKLAQHLKE